MAILSETIEGHLISIVVNSSNIKNGVYHTQLKTLLITFNNGSQYEYEDVPWEIFTKFRMSESQGKYFNLEIQKNYKYKKITNIKKDDDTI
jgi:hypothetical protein